MELFNADDDISLTERSPAEQRNGKDRRCGTDRRNAVRYEATRRKNHGRRKEDRDPWKDALEFE